MSIVVIAFTVGNLSVGKKKKKEAGALVHNSVLLTTLEEQANPKL